MADEPQNDRSGLLRILRSMRIMDAHCQEIERIATELGKRGLLDLADDLRMSVRKLRPLRIRS
jgi:hypothetical protein